MLVKNMLQNINEQMEHEQIAPLINLEIFDPCISSSPLPLFFEKELRHNNGVEQETKIVRMSQTIVQCDKIVRAAAQSYLCETVNISKLSITSTYRLFWKEETYYTSKLKTDLLTVAYE